MAQNYSTYFSHNPGVLDKKVTLMRRRLVIDKSGAPQNTWFPVCDVMAAIEPISGREYWMAAQSNREATVRIVIRYREGINDSMRVLYKAKDRVKVYEMKSVPINTNEENRYLQLMCNEIENEDGGVI